jgi:signal peptidase I
MFSDRLEPEFLPDEIADGTLSESASRYLVLGLQIGRLAEPSGKPLRMKVTSGSMSPLLRPGDFVHMQFASPESMRCGDVVVFILDQHLVTHRLISVGRPSFCTKGDALHSADAPIDRSQLLGRVVAFERNDKTIQLSGLFWHGFNRIAGLSGLLETRAAGFGDHLFQRKREAQPPAWWTVLVRLGIGLFRLPMRAVLRIYYGFTRL